MSPDRIAGLLAHAPVFDGHNDLAWELRRRVRYDFEALDIAGDLSATGLHTDIPRLRAGGVGAQFWSVYVPCHLGGDAAVAAVLEQVDAVRRLTERYPADLALAVDVVGVERATRRAGSPRCSAPRAATRSPARWAYCGCCTRSACGT